MRCTIPLPRRRSRADRAAKEGFDRADDSWCRRRSWWSALRITIALHSADMAIKEPKYKYPQFYAVQLAYPGITTPFCLMWAISRAAHKVARSRASHVTWCGVPGTGACDSPNLTPLTTRFSESPTGSWIWAMLVPRQSPESMWHGNGSALSPFSILVLVNFISACWLNHQ
jgi:hypothetical protein